MAGGRTGGALLYFPLVRRVGVGTRVLREAGKHNAHRTRCVCAWAVVAVRYPDRRVCEVCVACLPAVIYWLVA